MAQEFAKLNGYEVKDAKARQQISELDTAVKNKLGTTDVVNDLTSEDTTKPLSAKQGKELALRVKSIEDLKPIFVDKDTSADEFFNAYDSMDKNLTPVIYLDDDYEQCQIIGCKDIGGEPKYYFMKASTNSYIVVTTNTENDTVNVVTQSIDASISINYDSATETLTIGG